MYKVHLMKECLDRGIKVISSMGAANKTDPTRFTISDIQKHILIQWPEVIRQKLKKLEIRKGIPVVFVQMKVAIVIREDVKDIVGDKNAINRKGQMPPSSNAFVPSVVGLICASYVVNDVIKRYSQFVSIKDKGQ